MRSFAFILAVVAAYLLLRGHPERMPVLLRTCVAVLVLVAGLGFWGRRVRPREGTASSRRLPGWLDYAAIGMAVLALECVFVLFFSAAPLPLELAAERLESWWRPAAAAEREAGGGGASQAGNWLWNDHQRRPLPRRTNLKPGNRPEVFLRPADGEAAGKLLQRRIYVGAFALGRYETGAWSTRAVARETVKAGPDGWLRLPEIRDAPAVECEVFHAADHPSGNPLTALQGVVAVEMPELTRLDDGLHVLPPPGEEGYDYRTVSRPVTLDDLPRGSPSTVPATAPPEWLELPPGAMGARLAELAELAAGEGDTVQRLRNLRGHLRTTLAYSLQTENRKDLDPLENFLFEEQKGHCEFFATAGALLARSLGVPSRVAYGWAGGTYYEGSNLFVFRSREAHAWTEVLLEGHGWTVLDATPPGALERELAETAAPDEKPPGNDELLAAEEDAVFTDAGGLKAPLLLAAAFVLPALVLMALRSRRAGPAGDGAAGDRGGADGYFAAFRRASRRHGLPFGSSRTLRRHVTEMADAPEFARELQAYHYAVRYEGRPPDRKTEQRLRKAAEEWK
jgi:transglutaminase-like putative cysteine protease